MPRSNSYSSNLSTPQTNYKCPQPISNLTFIISTTSYLEPIKPFDGLDHQ